MNTSEVITRLEQYGDRLLKPAEAVPFLGKAEGTLANQRAAGIGCPFIKDGKTVAYHPRDIAAYIAARRRTPVAA
jgi:hypothetical protein